MSTREKRSRGITITLNNYSEEEYNNILELTQQHSEKYIFGKEIGENEKTPHIQGYIYFKNARTLKQVIKLYNNKRIHFEHAKGTPEQNYNYCSKDNDFISKGLEKKQETKKYSMEEILDNLILRINKEIKFPERHSIYNNEEEPYEDANGDIICDANH